VPSEHPTLTAADVRAHVERTVFGGDGPHDRTGVELEFLLSRPADRGARPGPDEVREVLDAVGRPPAGSRVTIEPGGQVEVSSPPLGGAAAACAAAAADLRHLDLACRALGLELVALGADPLREPARIVAEPRYDAMEGYFDGRNRAGRTMMCNTASIQVNLGLGEPRDRWRRWELCNLLGPVLIATFANSPFAGGGPSGWVSTRWRAWQTLDPSRSAPVPLQPDPVDAFTTYALDARVMLIRVGSDDYRAVSDPLDLGTWLRSGHELGWPSQDDLEYHLTTLFPPVRPRGWLEVRMVDALPTPWWQIAVETVSALAAEPEAGAEAAAACRPVATLWADAAQLGLGHPDLQRAAARTMALALEVMEAGDAAISDAARAFVERFTDRGRAPADERLDTWRRTGELFPPPLSPVLPEPHPASSP